MDRLLDLTRQAEEHHFWYHGFRSYLHPVFAGVADGRATLRVLDCGCGTGHNLQTLRQYGSAFGLDLSEGGLALARQVGRPLVRADAAVVPFASATFDLVTSFDMLQCIPTDREAVREMARVLKPGGVAVMSMAALPVLHGDHSEVWREYRRYTRATARALAEQAGLRVERVSYMFAALVPLMFVTRGVQRLTRPYRAVRDDTDISIPAAPVNALLSSILRMEAALARRVEMPMGSSLLVVARKPMGRV
jgi:SAM-dependent methyltransferase